MVIEHSKSDWCDQGTENLTLFNDKFNLNVNNHMWLVTTVVDSALVYISHKSTSLPMGLELAGRLIIQNFVQVFHSRK